MSGASESSGRFIVLSDGQRLDPSKVSYCDPLIMLTGASHSSAMIVVDGVAIQIDLNDSDATAIERALKVDDIWPDDPKN